MMNLSESDSVTVYDDLDEGNGVVTFEKCVVIKQ